MEMIDDMTATSALVATQVFKLGAEIGEFNRRATILKRENDQLKQENAALKGGSASKTVTSDPVTPEHEAPCEIPADE